MQYSGHDIVSLKFIYSSNKCLFDLVFDQGLHCIWLAYVAIRAMVISGPEPLSKALSAPLFLMQIGSVVMSITCVSTRFIRTMLC